ncbi:MAG: hypothetical protein BGO49_01840 [Planctomycetales bacterium 71-10]|nr:MAG: hypothetical protein BGO49_01840 [Planctomycetales bacterium 71-10]
MELTFECPECRMIDHTEDVESAGRAICRHCNSARGLRADAFDASTGLRACPLCGGADLYVRKDFSTAMGLAIVIAGFAVATGFWYYERPSSAYMVLGASVLMDMALYRRVPDVVVCYRCSGQLRGPGINPGGRFRTFDLGVNERYRQERLRAAALRARGASAAAVEPGAEADADAT